MTDLEDLVTGADVARRLGVSRERVRQLAERDDFPDPLGRLGNYVVWRSADIEAWDIRNRSVHFEVDGTVYALDDRLVTILAEKLRNYGAGNFAGDVEKYTPSKYWLAGAISAGEWIETWLVSGRENPLPVEPGPIADALYWVLRLSHLDPTDPRGGAALRDALAEIVESARWTPATGRARRASF